MTYKSDLRFLPSDSTVCSMPKGGPRLGNRDLLRGEPLSGLWLAPPSHNLHRHFLGHSFCWSPLMTFSLDESLSNDDRIKNTEELWYKSSGSSTSRSYGATESTCTAKVFWYRNTPFLGTTCWMAPLQALLGFVTVWFCDILDFCGYLTNSHCLMAVQHCLILWHIWFFDCLVPVPG